MDFTVLNATQRGQWNKFYNGLQEINRRFGKSRFDMWWIQQAIDTYKKHTEALPPSFQYDRISQWQGIANKWMQGVTALNNAYALTQAGSAYVSPSKAVPGDMDIVVEQGTLPDSVVQGATFDQDLPTGDGTLEGWPLVVGAALVITGLIIVSGMVSKVADSIVKHKKLDVNIERIKANLTKDMKSASPEVLAAWQEVEKTQIKPAEKGFFESLKEGAGGFALVAVAAVAIMFAWKFFGGRKE
jgi:hypothetical protein